MLRAAALNAAETNAAAARLYAQQMSEEASFPPHSAKKSPTSQPSVVEPTATTRSPVKGLFKAGAILAIGAVIDDFGGDALPLGPGNAAGIFVVRDDDHRPRCMVAGHIFDQRPHVRPAPRDKNRNALRHTSVPL